MDLSTYDIDKNCSESANFNKLLAGRAQRMEDLLVVAEAYDA